VYCHGQKSGNILSTFGQHFVNTWSTLGQRLLAGGGAGAE
jgi:hypothetical protein